MLKGGTRVQYFLLLLTTTVLITGLFGGYILFHHFGNVQAVSKISPKELPWKPISRHTTIPQGLHYGQSSVLTPPPKELPWKPISRHATIPQGLHYGQSRVLTPPRSDVLTASPWLAPIVWEGTFDPVVIDSMYKPLNLTIATTVFAVGKYTRFLGNFLETAEQHYMVGFKVHYYIFTDQPEQVPAVTLAPGRMLSITKVPKFSRWQEISLRRMEIIQTAIEEHIHKEADYIFCLDVDMKFHNRWGSEVLDTLVAAIHPWFYTMDRKQFTYERRPASKAYVPMDQGDFYYAGAVYGGRVEDVYKLTKTCRENLEEDKKNNLEAIWQEESHLNRYLVYKKPTKLLSPEYIWDDAKNTKKNPVLRLIRLSSVIKIMANVREN